MQSHPEWEVLNRGVNGERSDQIRDRFDRDVISAGPAVVVVIAGVNDVYQGREVEHVTGTCAGCMTGPERPVFAWWLVLILLTTRQRRNRTRRCARSMRGSGCRRTRIPTFGFADTRAAVGAPGKPDLLSDSPDHLHPSPTGYRAMAGAIRPVIEQILR